MTDAHRSGPAAGDARRPERAVRSPVAARRRLRVALRRARDHRRLTQDQVAEAMDWSLSKVIRIENGLVNISTNDLRALLSYYHVTDADAVHRFVGLARVGRARPWWAGYREVLGSPQFMTMMGLETDAEQLSLFNPNMIPGLLQTEAYARRSLQGLVPEPTSEQLEIKVSVRLRRQSEVLDRPDPPEILAVLDEAALRRMIADLPAMRAQLGHLRTLAERPNVTIEVVPFSAGVYDLAGPFTVLSFPDGEDPEVAYLESALAEELIEDPERIKVYHQAFQAIRGKALNRSDSLAFIDGVADELR